MEGALLALVVLACPVGMGLMMWFMAKGMRGEKAQVQAGEQPGQASLEELKAEQARLGAEIERLDGQDGRERVGSAPREGG
ncbi:MAG: hypothetical protein ACRDL3_05160 [Solirubrobacterales bacterium]